MLAWRYCTAPREAWLEHVNWHPGHSVRPPTETLYTHSSAPLFYRCVGRVSAYLSAVLQAAVAARNDKWCWSASGKWVAISGTGGAAGIGKCLLCVVTPFGPLFSCPSISPSASLLTFVLFLALDIVLAHWCFVGALAVPTAFAFASKVVHESTCGQSCPWVTHEYWKIALLRYLKMRVKLWIIYRQVHIFNAHLNQ